MSKEKVVLFSEQRTLIVERHYVKDTKTVFHPLDHVDVEVFHDDELIYQERMSEEWYRYKGMNPVIEALTHLSATK